MQLKDDGRNENKNPAFGGVMIKCKNKVLLCKRSDDLPEHLLPSYWSVPSGYVEPNEEIKTAAIRETFEETKIKLNDNDVKFLSAFETFDKTGVFYDYICEIDSEVEPILDFEHSEWGYFSVDEIPSPITSEMKNDVILALS